MELTPQQMQILTRLVEAGLRPIAIPPYEKAMCLYRGEMAVVLAPTPDGKFAVIAPGTYLVDGNLSVKLRRGGKDVFVWKQKEIEATQERVSELERFRAEVAEILGSGTKQ